MNRLPTIIKSLPKIHSVTNCNVCYDNGLRNMNKFEIFDDIMFKYFVCLRCGSIHRLHRIKRGGLK